MSSIRILILLQLFVGLVACEVAENEGMDKEMNTTENKNYAGRPVFFYNVENLFDTVDDPRTNDNEFTPEGDKLWDFDRYEEKLDRIGSVLSRMPEMPVLVGLVEIENRQVLQDLITSEAMNDINYRFVHYDSPDKRGIDCALLYDADIFEVISSTKYPVRLEDEPNFATRDILYVHGRMKDGVQIHVFVNHWSSRREGKEATEHKRLAAAKVLREEVDEIQKITPDANILILGDFNDYPDDKSLSSILRAKESGFESQGDLINLLYDEHIHGEGTIVHEGDWGVFDQIIVSQSFYDASSGIGIAGRNAHILKDDDLLYVNRRGEAKPNASFGGDNYYGGFSDHLPVYIILK